MWFRTLFDSPNRRRPRPPVRPAPRRLAVEVLEDRAVPAWLSAGDVTILEGVAGTQNAAVIVSLDEPSTRTVKVNYKTMAGSATAGSDYDAVSGRLTFAPGETSKSIPVPVRGDRVAEADESFSVKLSKPTNARLANSVGNVTIQDSTPRIGIADGSIWEGDSGTTLMAFTVSLRGHHDEPLTVDFATQDGDAIAGQDYVAASGTLTFAPGETSKTIMVEIIGDAVPEYDEYFSVNLSGASGNAIIFGATGSGWIADGYGQYWYYDDSYWWYYGTGPGEYYY